MVADPCWMTVVMTQLSSSDVPGMGRRQFMNLLTFGSVTGVALGALYPVVGYFIPPGPPAPAVAPGQG